MTGAQTRGGGAAFGSTQLAHHHSSPVRTIETEVPMAEDNEPRTIAEAYFECWRARDWTRLRSLLDDDATFRGPLATIEGADALVDGLQGLARITTDIVVHKRFEDGPDVLTWFDLHTSVASPAPTANWTHVEDGKITAIQVTFDARELAPPNPPRN
jgi:hypothetical protein